MTNSASAGTSIAHARAPARSASARRAGSRRRPARRCPRAAAPPRRAAWPGRRRPRPRPAASRPALLGRVVVEAAALADLPVHAGGLRVVDAACGRRRGCARCVSGCSVSTSGKVTKRPPSFGHSCRIGQRATGRRRASAPAPAPCTTRRGRMASARAALPRRAHRSARRRGGSACEDLLQLRADGARACGRAPTRCGARRRARSPPAGSRAPRTCSNSSAGPCRLRLAPGDLGDLARPSRPRA